MIDKFKKLLDTIPRRIITPRLEITLLDLDRDSDAISDELTGDSWDDMHSWVSWVTSKEALSRTGHRKTAQENVEAFLSGDSYFGVSRLRSNGTLGPQVTLYHINHDSNTGEYGYWAPKLLTGQKLTQEASIAMLMLGRDFYGLKKIFADHSLGNVASKRVLENLGFKFSHVEKDGAQRGSGEKIDAVHYVLDDMNSIPKCEIQFI